MFEFLKECDEFSIYDRALSCLKYAQDSNFIILARIYFEAAVKTIYYYEYSADKLDVEYMTFYDLLNRDELIEIIREKYNFKNVFMLNFIARKKGNQAAHAAVPESINEEQKKSLLREIYVMGKGIYECKTGKTVKDIDEEELDDCFKIKQNPESLKKVAETYALEIKRIKSELEEANRNANNQNEEINRILKEKELLADKIIEQQNNLQILEKQIENAKYEKVPKDDYDLKCAEIKTKEDIIERYSGDIKILKTRVENAERSKNATEYEKLNKQYNNLKTRLEREEKEKLKLHNSLDALAEGRFDVTVLAKLYEKYELVKKEYDELLLQHENTKELLKIAEKKQLSLGAFADIERKESSTLPIWDEYRSLLSKAKNLEDKKKAIIKKIDAISPYTCRYCGEKLKVKYSWYCINGLGSRGNVSTHLQCKTSRREIEPCDREIIQEIEKLNLEKNEYANLSNKAWQRFNEYKSDNQEILSKPEPVYRLTNEEKIKLETDVIRFEQSPEFSTVDEPVSFLFESIAVPRKVFDFHRKYDLEYYSKFRVWYGDELNVVIPESKKRIVYTLIQRLMNRGIVLCASKLSEEFLSEKFNVAGCCRLHNLVDFVKYDNPAMSYENSDEKIFAEKILPRVYGSSWASYVSTKIPYTMLESRLGEISKSGQADILLYGPEPNSTPIIFKISNDKSSKEFEELRRVERLLSNYNYELHKYNISQLKNNISIIETQIKDHFAFSRSSLSIDTSERYLVACKISHQIAIAIAGALEKGYISDHANLKIDISSDYFDDGEAYYILSSAIMEIETLINRYARLYGFDIGCNLRDETKQEVVIHVGNGSPDFSGITIRDCFLPNDYMCKLEPFDVSYNPLSDPDEELLEFFLKYIFGFDEFREGQVEALKRILGRKDSIILLATGAGKSLIYQIVGYLVPGMVVIISPLRALITDQINNLRTRYGITNAIGIVSNNTERANAFQERRAAASHMKNNVTSLLYISPERMLIPEFRDDIDNTLKKTGVYAVAIDEAHCVSEWGHDFRPAYLTIGKNTREIFLKEEQSPVIIALTGTASTGVLQDIKRTMGIMDDDAVVWPESFERSELQFSAFSCAGNEKIDNLSFIIRNDISENDEMSQEGSADIQTTVTTPAGIIFAPFARGSSTQYSVSAICAALIESLPGLNVDRYSSRRPNEWEEESWNLKISKVAEDFNNDNLDVLVATKAFGMGIDKSNIRYTIHDGMPQSIESFYQEAGRAGRDGRNSKCFLLFSDDNAEFNARLLDPNLSLEELRSLYYSRTDVTDDIHAQLLFHLSQYKGLEIEKETVRKILVRINDCLINGDTKCVIPCSIQENNEDSSLTFTKEELQENGTAIAHGIIRLMKLGMVHDYQYNYRERKFYIELGNISIDKIKDNYLEYIATFDQADKKIQAKKIQKYQDSFETRLQISYHLLDYTYEKIEMGRRNQIIHMYNLAKKVCGKNADEQDSIIRESLNNYFSIPSSNENDPVNAIVKADKPHMEYAWNLFGINRNPDKNTFSKEERKKAAEIGGRAAREAESALGSRPDLILLRDICYIVSGNYSADSIANDMVFIMKNGREGYKLYMASINKALGIMFNLEINTDYRLFEKTVKKIAEYKEIPEYKLLESAGKNIHLSNNNRTLVMMMYYLKRVEHML